MNSHPYWRAYMAGIVVPTIVVLFGMFAFVFARYVYNIPLPIERVIVFPMAAVPNLWGLWNVLHLKLGRPLSLGAFGAILPLILAPAGWLVTIAVNFPLPHIVLAGAPFALPIGIAIYYLVWKHVVGSLNAIVGLP